MLNESPLLTKLHAPPARAKRVLRPRLTARLNEGLARKLILISAMAGAGKTTLLTEWQLTLANQLSLAWVSLDEHDDDLARFWTYVITALQTIQPRLGARARWSLDSMALPNLSTARDDRAWIESALTSLINDLVLTPNDVALVLDDYHSIELPIIHDSVTFLLDHLPPNLHLIIASREDPPLPLARLRARHQMIELRSADLRFTPDEVIAFFDEVMGLPPLARQDCSAIEARTEGWIAGLQMAALALREHQDPSHFIASFTGSHHFVMDYLIGEVLQRQPQDIQAFLLQTSVLDRLNGALCDAVTGRTDSQTILEKLDASNLFLVPLDSERRWYRYHHLFAELLRHRSSLSRSEELSVLHHRASVWYEQADELFDAINHAVAVKDWEHIAQLLERIAQKNRMPWMYGEVNRISRWLDALPSELVRARPHLSLACTWTRLLANQFDRAEQHLNDAVDVQSTIHDANDKRALQGEIATARTFLASMRGEMAQIIEPAHQALASLPEQETFLRSLIALSLADAHYVRNEIELGQRAYAQALSWSQAAGNHAVALMALNGLASHLHLRGKLRQAERLLQQTIALANECGGQDFFILSEVYWTLGWVRYSWNDVGSADEAMSECLRIARQWKFPILSVYACGAWAVMKQAQGDEVGASEMLRHAELAAQESSASFIATLLAYYRLWVWTSQGNLPAAMRLIQEHAPEWGDKHSRTYALLTRAVARTFIAQGQAESDPALIRRALESLQEVLPQSEAMGLDGDIIVNLSLQALAYQALGQMRHATRALARVLTLAEPEGNIRLFVDFGKPMAQLLVRVAESEPGLRSYASKLLAHFEAGTVGEKLVEPLTERELEVLQRVASGATDQDIAEQLVLSKATVKTHLRNIYGKLQVKNRTQAIVRAQVLRLLP